MRPFSSPSHCSILRASRTVSMPRAAVRPSVEKSTSGPTFSLPRVSPTIAWTSLWPLAYATSIRATGPTCIALPSYRGAFIHVYLVSSCRYFHGGFGPVYFGVVSPSWGCRPTASPFSYSYHELWMNSRTFFGSYSWTFVRSLSCLLYTSDAADESRRVDYAGPHT